MRPSLLGEKTRHRKPTDFSVIEHNWNVFPWLVNLRWAIPVGLRAGIDPDLAVDQFDDPIDGEGVEPSRQFMKRS